MVTGDVPGLGRTPEGAGTDRGGRDPGEVVCRRLVLVDADGVPRLVAEVAGDTAELRLEVPGAPPGRRAAVVLHASRSPVPLLGVQLWADGEVLAELDAWPGGDGVVGGGGWHPGLHLEGGR